MKRKILKFVGCVLLILFTLVKIAGIISISYIVGNYVTDIVAIKIILASVVAALVTCIFEWISVKFITFAVRSIIRWALKEDVEDWMK